MHELMEYSFSREDRTLYMHGEVDGRMAELFLKGMHILQAESDSPISVIMNNEGGDIYHGLAIYDAIAECPCQVTIYAYGHAMSMGSWIMQAADHRVMMPNCTMMLHAGTVEIEEDLSPTQIQAHAKEMTRLSELMLECYVIASDGLLITAELRNMLEAETYLTAEEAVEMGLADEVGGDS